jgi:hypothetical protein
MTKLLRAWLTPVAATVDVVNPCRSDRDRCESSDRWWGSPYKTCSVKMCRQERFDTALSQTLCPCLFFAPSRAPAGPGKPSYNDKESRCDGYPSVSVRRHGIRRTDNQSISRRWHPLQRSRPGGVAGALTVLVVWILGMFHVQVPPEVASALTIIISFFASYFVRERVPAAADVTDATGATGQPADHRSSKATGSGCFLRQLPRIGAVW